MKYISVKEASKKWGISERRVRILCSENRIDGVTKSSWAWNIPSNAPKPSDGRTIRHIKNIDLRVDTINFSSISKKKEDFNNIISSTNNFKEYYDKSVNNFLLFALSDENFTESDILDVLSYGENNSLSMRDKLLIINAKTILVNFFKQSGYGPVLSYMSKTIPFLSEQRLNDIYLDLYKGVDDYKKSEYRNAKLVNPSAFEQKEYDIDMQMETLIFQYENDWSYINSVVKASFMFAGLLRIKPFEEHSFLFASLIFAAILLEDGYPLAIIPNSLIKELKADLTLTLRRSNYTKLINLFLSSIEKELDNLLSI